MVPPWGPSCAALGACPQLDRVSRQLLARAWAAGAGPHSDHRGLDHLRGLWTGQGSAHGYTGPALSPAAGHCRRHRRGLMSRLREGRANTARGAAHFLRETVGRVRYGGARGQLTVRADSGFYAHTVAGNGRPARQPAGPDRGDTRGGDSHSLLDGRRRRCRRDLTPRSRPSHAAPVRLCEGVPSSPSSPDTAITPSSPTAMGRRWNWRPIAATPRLRDLKYGVGLTVAGSVRLNPVLLRSSLWWDGYPLGAPPHFAGCPGLSCKPFHSRPDGHPLAPPRSHLASPAHLGP